MTQMRNVGREIGTALAVLAIYLLTVLSPLHQVRASQLALDQLGYAMAQPGWVLCTSAGVEGEEDDLSVAKCPALGLGKAAITLPKPHALPAAYRIAVATPPLTTSPAALPRAIAPPVGPRAPPVPV